MLHALSCKRNTIQFLKKRINILFHSKCSSLILFDANVFIHSSRPGRPPKRGPVGLLPASHLSHHPQMKKHRLDNGDYPYENGHMNGEFDQYRLNHSA